VTYLDETRWIDAHVVRTGEVEVTRVRPWAVVRRIPTEGGTVWMKAPRSGTAFEVPLYALLARVVPERVLTPIAIDVERGWLLLPDGGPPLWDHDDWLDGLVEALVEYGRLQRALAPHAGDMLALGVHDMRPAAMPARFREALAAAGDRPEVAALEPVVGEWCERLAASSLPPSLDHNDLHPGNVLAGPRYYDWGDAVIAHPFAVALVPLGLIAHRYGEAAVARARDAYLAGFGEPGELVEALELACRVAKIARALTWVRALEGAVDPEWADAPRKTLRRLLHDHYLA
jgi:Phosphotransferase enzyme family